jgi:hypothetical protein
LLLRMAPLRQHPSRRRGPHLTSPLAATPRCRQAAAALDAAGAPASAMSKEQVARLVQLYAATWFGMQQAP